MSTLRQALAAAPPPVSMVEAWRAFQRALRAHGRATGARGLHADRAALERCLDQPAPEDPQALRAVKVDLRDLVHGGAGEIASGALAARIDAALRALGGEVVAGPVEVVVEGWPPGVDAGLRAALVGRPGGGPWMLAAEEAAGLVRALDGQVLGGAVLAVRVALAPGQRLPAPAREARDRSRRGGETPWLPHLDEEGSYSLTPRDLALRQAALLPGPLVIDAFCGCGGNAIALALAGRRVVAVERDPQRLALARRNARALGVALELVEGDVRALLPGILARHPGADLLLDPPWGGPGSAGRSVGWGELVPLPVDLLAACGRVLLKAPRAFALRSLPAPRRWSWTFERSAPGADGRAAVACITCLGVPA